MLDDAVIYICAIICVMDCVWNRHGSVRIRVTATDVNRMIELHFFLGATISEETFLRCRNFGHSLEESICASKLTICVIPCQRDIVKRVCPVV